MAGHLSTRIWNAAVTPVVREAGPRLAGFIRMLAQYVAFSVLGGGILIGVYFLNGLLPVKPIVMGLSLVPMLFAFLVIGDLVHLTYRKSVEVAYPAVEAFEQREPPGVTYE